MYKIIPFPVVLCGYESFSLTRKEEYNLTMFKNKMLRRILGLKMEKETGEWKKLHSEDLPCSMHLAGHVVRLVGDE